ncbi:MAG: glycoside hydrolase family 15 protein [Acidobacteriota bacterium]|nr:glycoside hydrolase family 15 protein [Acidobacteriota bacterium]
MSSRIEDYGMIGDCNTAALVSREGSIDWLCLPSFDSAACFASLLGDSENGRWLIAPACEVKSIHRKYREDTLILETTFETDGGAVTLVDCMTPTTSTADLVRLVVGARGQVPMNMELIIRFDYGSIVPWVRRTKDGLTAIAGPDTVRLRAPVELCSENFKTVAEFSVSAGQKIPFDLVWYSSHRDEPQPLDAEKVIQETEDWWRKWIGQNKFTGNSKDAVKRSLITLKALTFAPTGAIVASPTTSLPELIGGVRNWDYRFCWVRDATLSLRAMVVAGYLEEAKAWREWLIRAVAGKPSELNIVYGLRGERRLTELELPWLAGYENSKPVRTGNAAYNQLQLDVYGEIADTLYLCRQSGLQPDKDTSTGVGLALIEHLEGAWQEPDEGIWEVRGPRRNFTHSKMMAWVAMDRAVKSAEQGWVPNPPLERWRAVRSKIHEEVCSKGFDAELNSFVQFYGTKHLDASLLMMAIVGFLPPNDPRIRGTVEAIEKGLLSKDGFVRRYTTDESVDGIPHGEAAFLPCTYWLADNYAFQGRPEEAMAVFDRLLAIRNDLGLLSEEYDPVEKRLLGNFPQAFSHFGMVNTAYNLTANGASASGATAGEAASPGTKIKK